MKIIYFVVPVFVLTGILVLGVLTSMFMSIDTVNDYAIVFDAGSSGTRMFIYEWDSTYSTENKQKLIVNQVDHCITDDNGVDKITDIVELERMFAKCIAKAHELIPKDRKDRTKINLAATAGMRLLEQVSAAKTNRTMEFIRDYFRSTGFRMDDNSQVKIISGKEEAISGWISANYIENNFNWLNPLPPYETAGFMDLGGASTQIIFVPEHPDPKYSINVRIFGYDYQTYSESFLCFGMEQANLMYKANLVKSKSAPIKRPLTAHCFPNNITLNLTKAQKAASPCINGMVYKDSNSPDFLSTDNNFNGASDFDECVRDVRKMFTIEKKCQIGTDFCSFHDVYIADVKLSKFMAVSGFYYNLQNTNKLFNLSLNRDLIQFRRTTSHLCSMSWNQLIELNAMNNAGISRNRLINMCFANTYTLELLSSYGFESLDNIQIVKKLNGKKISWTLGYLINALNQQGYLPKEEKHRHLSSVSYQLSLLILAPTIGFISILIGCFIIKFPTMETEYESDIDL